MNRENQRAKLADVHGMNGKQKNKQKTLKLPTRVQPALTYHAYQETLLAKIEVVFIENVIFKSRIINSQFLKVFFLNKTKLNNNN